MRPQSFHNQMPPGRPFNQFQGPRGNFGGRPPRFPQPGMMPPPGRGPAPGPGIPGIGPGGASPKLQSFMDTANRFLATAQSFQPLVQQATPMFRNLPALWRIYKGFQGLPKTEGPNEHDQRESFNLEDSSEIPENFGRPDNFGRPENFGRPDNFGRPENFERPERPIRHERSQGPARQEMFARPSRPGRRERYEGLDISESPTYSEKVKPQKATTRPSMPRIFQPPYYFDE